MCFDNHAEISSRYINGQLRILYENAQYCVEKHGTDYKPMDAQVESAMCLSEFYVQSKDSLQPLSRADSLFFAKFGCPRVEFACNHEIILLLNLLEGQYSIDPNHSESQRKNHETIKKCTFAFRISFIRKTIQESINTGYVIDLHVLDMTTATFLPEFSTIPSSLRMLTVLRYLTEFYFPTLKRSGHHVLHSLPDFAEPPRVLKIDYSVISTREAGTVDHSEANITSYNKHLNTLWLEAAEFVNKHGSSGETNENSFLSEMRMTETEMVDGKEVPVYLRFGPMRIQLLCKREVILFLDIIEVITGAGRLSQKPKEKFMKWSIAFIIDIATQEIDKLTANIQLKVDTARICEPRSTYGEELKRYKPSLVQRFITYCKKVAKKFDHVVPVGPPELPPPVYTEYVKETVQRHILEHTHTAGFEVVAAFSQAAINAHFTLLWTSRSHFNPLAQFSYKHPDEDEVHFKAHFEAPQIKLICERGSRHATLNLRLSDCHLKLQQETEFLHYPTLSVAFEVELDIVDARLDTISSVILERYGLTDPTGFKQLVFNLSSAQSVLDEAGLTANRDIKESIDHYIREYYFPVFVREHYQVLYTIPQNVSGLHTGKHTFTTLQYEITPFLPSPEVQHHATAPSLTRNSIVIMGMIGGHSLPPIPLPHGMNWILGNTEEVPLGTVYLSRSSFLEKILLGLSERVNGTTTIVPLVFGVDDDKLIFDLEVWNNNKWKGKKKCNWNSPAVESNIVENLEFEWLNHEKWTYANEPSGKGIYSLNCLTRNVMKVPTKGMDESDIQISGMVTLQQNFKDNKEGQWSFEMTVSWSAVIGFVSAGSGLQVELRPARIEPKFNNPIVTHGVDMQTTVSLLQEKFPASVDFTDLIHELKHVLEGRWMGMQVEAHELCFSHPAFNRHGDLLLELIVYDPKSIDSQD